ncbi:MAG: ATP-grasp domain-containing protein, partial [Eubacteriales bacterium]|nr:ATP-grasp domain-containing protein [Eubacteriales bacterium]
MDNSSNKPLVVVLSRNYATGISVIRSLGEAGFDVDLVASAFREGNSEMAACSKYVGNAVEVVSRKVSDSRDVDLEAALYRYRRVQDRQIVLFPTDDYTTSVMDYAKNELKDFMIMPQIIGGDAGSLTRHMDKTVQGDMARRAGILTPMEWIISLADEMLDIPEDMVYPCFVKPIESVSGYKREMARCDSKNELIKHLRKLQGNFANRSVLVQEFLEIEGEIDFSGVCLDQEVIIPAIIKKTSVAKYEKGVTLAGQIVPFEELGDLQDNIIAMMKSFHYYGMFDFELAIAGGKLYFNEVNLRSGGPNFSYFMSGVNLPALFVNEALGLGHRPEDEQVEEYGKSFVYEKIAWEDYIHGCITKSELRKIISNADITLLHYDRDPAPGEYFDKVNRADLHKQRRKNFWNNISEIMLFFRAFFYSTKQLISRLRHGYPQIKRCNRRDPDAERPRVLVAGRNYCSNLTMARSLGEAGYEVEVLRIFQTKPSRDDKLRQKLRPDAYSRYIKAYHEIVTRRKNWRTKRKLINIADPDRKMLLIPADDLVAYIVDRYYDELKEYYIMPNVNDTEGEIGRLMEKETQKQLARQAGLPVLNSCVISADHGVVEHIPDTVTYPCFVKPNVSKNSAKSQMARCDDERSLRKALRKASRHKYVEMLVEDYVEIDKEYSILGVSTKEGAIGPGYFVAEKGGQEEHRGVAVMGRTLSTDDNQQLIDDIVRFIGTLGYDGLFDVDLIKTAEGKMYFVELNMRFGASGYAFTKSGVNL